MAVGIGTAIAMRSTSAYQTFNIIIRWFDRSFVGPYEVVRPMVARSVQCRQKIKHPPLRGS